MITNVPSMSIKMDISIGYCLNIQMVAMCMIYREIFIFPRVLASWVIQRLEVIRGF